MPHSASCSPLLAYELWDTYDNNEKPKRLSSASGDAMPRAELQSLLEAAKIQRDSALGRRIAAGKTTNKELLQELDTEIEECNEIIAKIERAIKKFESLP